MGHDRSSGRPSPATWVGGGGPGPRAADWLVGGGEMGRRIRSLDWSLSPIESWPQSRGAR